MTDLRLAPAALAAWGAAWLLTGPGSGLSGPVTRWAAVVVALACLVTVAVAARRLAVRPRLAVPPRPVPTVLAHGALVSACVLAVTLSAHVQLSGRSPVADLAEQRVTVTLSGVVVSEPEPFSFGPGGPRPEGTGPGEVGPGTEPASAPGRYRWVLAARSVDARAVSTAAGAHVQVLSGTAPRYGATVTVSGTLRAADPGAPDAARLTADGAHEIRAPPSFLGLLDTHRTALLAVTDPLAPQARGLVPGAAIGDTTRLPADLADEMRVSGLSHVTAVSGGHFAVVVAVLTLLCSAARLPRSARVALVALAALTFVLLVRPEPAVLRAAVMASFALAGVAAGRPAQSAPALAASVVGLLVVDPWLARSFGFALSAAATAGLVLLAAPLAARLAPWTGEVVAFALAVPLAAQAACGPVLVLLDPSVSTVSVMANALAAPAVVPATVLGLVATVLAPWVPVLAGAVAWLAGCATWWIATVAHVCATLPGATAPWLGGPPGALLLAGVTGLVLWAALRGAPRPGWPEAWRAAVRSGVRGALGLGRHGMQPVRPHELLTARRRSGPALAAVLLAAGTVVVLVVATAVPRLVARGEAPEDWQVAACDVGQGDALVLRTGPASAVVVDVGPAGSAAGRCLDRLGVARVDLLVLSHFHADHVGGLGPVLAGREVTAALVSPVAEPAAGAAATTAALAAAGVPVRPARTGDQGVAGTVAWRVPLAGAGTGANDSSVVLAARTAGLDVVLLGDLEDAGQAALVPLVGPADVVKVAHHGSAVQSVELARRLRPAVALVSSGRDNDYGHPTDEALDLYAGLGAAVVRTDECGTVALVVRGGEVGLAGC
ncbi:ComEC/Rec2 family competence protein [Promicromonospora sp. NPDC052451]|uniref:ComEC/Rec2 family competence protein n=1 Tax=Promicromonospora sp. NPDC052451 TaxID=3364407 RepID=UPI0037C596D1